MPRFALAGPTPPPSVAARRTALLPRFLGVLLMLDGIGVGIWFLQGLLWPALKAITYPGLAVSLVAEAGLALWLLAKGVKVVDSGEGRPA